MKKYIVYVPLCAVEVIEVEAETLEEAIELGYQEVEHDNSIGYDPESISDSWAEE